MTDRFVIRKHASMLADAGVDFIVFDTTNPPGTFRPEYEALCREYAAMRAEGTRTPAIAFLAPFGDPRGVTDQLWRDLYQPGRWKNLWLQGEGKPLLLANKSYIKDPTMLDFFTFRRPMPDYWKGPSGPDQWSWLEVHPQHVFKTSQGEAEQMSVGVAQNALPGTPGPAPMSHRAGAMGRSWHGGKKDQREGAINLGLNFEEQWRRAMKVDPRVVFVTGWNEWIAGRYTTWSKYTDADCYFAGGLFVDEYDAEYSRDCEPMTSGFGDNYYYQLASWIRRFKGARETPKARGPGHIAIDGEIADWNDIAPEFRDTVGDTIHRDHKGYGDLIYRDHKGYGDLIYRDHKGYGDLIYRDETGRNDFASLKASYDEANIYFLARAAKSITPRTDRNWMLLFIDSDQNLGTGRMGYDFAINLEVTDDRTTTVKAWREGDWKTVATAHYVVKGQALEIAVPRSAIEQSSATPSFDFHWADNIEGTMAASDFGLHGDSAPNRRWNYRYGVDTR
jgi:hypothetical protein